MPYIRANSKSKIDLDYLRRSCSPGGVHQSCEIVALNGGRFEITSSGLCQKGIKRKHRTFQTCGAFVVRFPPQHYDKFQLLISQSLQARRQHLSQNVKTVFIDTYVLQSLVLLVISCHPQICEAHLLLQYATFCFTLCILLQKDRALVFPKLKSQFAEFL